MTTMLSFFNCTWWYGSCSTGTGLSCAMVEARRTTAKNVSAKQFLTTRLLPTANNCALVDWFCCSRPATDYSPTRSCATLSSGTATTLGSSLQVLLSCAIFNKIQEVLLCARQFPPG